MPRALLSIALLCVAAGFARAQSPEPPPIVKTRCAACHGQDGGGLKSADGGYVMPPVWGPQSFNDGAGLARPSVAAAFIRTKMPLGRGGSLDEQDAWDLAAFVTSMPRPAYAGSAKDYPRGGRPAR